MQKKLAYFPIPISNLPIHDKVMEAESAPAAICFMCGIGEVWKCSVVIRKDRKEEERAEEEEVEAEMAVASAMRIA